MTCNVVWLRQALAEYQNRLNNVLFKQFLHVRCQRFWNTSSQAADIYHIITRRSRF